MRVWALALTLLAGCGSAGSTADPHCDQTLQKLCTRAAACPTTDNKVRVLQSGQIVATDDQPSCAQAFVGSSCAGFDQAACAAAIDSAACTPAADLLPGGFTRPNACYPSLDGGF